MKRLLKPFTLIFMVSIVISCSNDNKVVLFNGDNLDNWYIYVSTPEVEPGDLFRAVDGVIRTTGIPTGYIRTKDTYSNYKLHVEWRWTGEPINSGVLINIQGEDMIWPLCTECQLKHGNAGDVVCIRKGSGITIKDSTYLVTSDENLFSIAKKFEESSEVEAGGWNSYDITNLDGNIEVTVNGVLQNSGSGMTLTEGKIGLQAEGAPMEFRNIYLKPL
jgi:hypothetical protein